MFRDALGYPTRPPSGGRSVLVGGGLLFLAVVLGTLALALSGAVGDASAGSATLVILALPVAAVGLLGWLVVRGYYVRVIRTTIGRERPRPPPFDAYAALLVDGLRAVAVGAVYLAVPLLVVVVGAVAPLALAGDASGGVASGITTVAGLVVLLGLLGLVGALYAVPAAVANFAYTGRVAAAFDVRTVAAAVFTEDYVVAWAISVVFKWFVLPFAQVLRLLAVGFFLEFHLQTGVRYLYGRGFGLALDLDPLPAPADRARTDVGGAHGGRRATKLSVPIGNGRRPANGESHGTSTTVESHGTSTIADGPDADEPSGGTWRRSPGVNGELLEWVWTEADVGSANGPDPESAADDPNGPMAGPAGPTHDGAGSTDDSDGPRIHPHGPRDHVGERTDDVEGTMPDAEETVDDVEETRNEGERDERRGGDG